MCFTINSAYEYFVPLFTVTLCKLTSKHMLTKIN